MNVLPHAKRATILQMLCEGSSMRSISRVTGVSMRAITKLLEDAGDACAAFHDRAVRRVQCSEVQMDEIWAFIYAKESNVETARRAPEEAGSIWTWLAMDRRSKLIISWWVGPREAESAYTLLQDLRFRIGTRRIQLTSDGLPHYVAAVEEAFGGDVDYAQLVKKYGGRHGEDQEERRYSPSAATFTRKNRISGNPDRDRINTSIIERQNLNVRMGVRRFTRLSNAFSKKGRNHVHAVSTFVVFHNFVRIHSAHRMTPAMAAGLTAELREPSWLVDLVNERAPPPGPRQPYRFHRRPGRTAANARRRAEREG